MNNHSFGSIQKTLQVFKENKKAAIGAIVLMVVLFVAIFAPIIAPYDDAEMNVGGLLSGPSWDHLMGTDNYGRDVFSRIIFGSRISLIISVSVIIITTVIGLPLGIMAGYYGRWIDNIVTSLANVLLSFPWLLMVLTVVAILGPGVEIIILSFGIVYSPQVIRLSRGIAMSVKEREFVDSAIVIGESNFSIMRKYILPNCIGPIIIQLTLLLSEVVLAAAAVSYLGYGTQPPTPGWGLMLSQSSKYMLPAPFLSIFPGVVIMVLVLSVNFFGDGLRDILDPKETK